MWSVESTSWPVSADRTAISAVSASRISPTMITSGSWRSSARSPRAKVSPTSGSTWVWRIEGRWYSTGSSSVTMFRSTVLICPMQE